MVTKRLEMSMAVTSSVALISIQSLVPPAEISLMIIPPLTGRDNKIKQKIKIGWRIVLYPFTDKYDSEMKFLKIFSG